MLLFYDFGIAAYNFLIILFSPFNHKAKLWVDGRKRLLQTIEKQVTKGEKHSWFHFASLGEFEQGRPVLEAYKARYSEKKIVVTFFSPSGYEVRKNYPLADHVFYLPLDTKANASKFIKLINPELAVFTKYDYWYHYLNELKKVEIPACVISAIFRKEQPFFKWYGLLNRKMLGLLTKVFVQDYDSKELLNTIDINQVTVSGDTRFDRVVSNAMAASSFLEIDNFVEGKKTLVAGSTWPEDEKLIASLLTEYPDWKIIIAPHEITESHLTSIEKLFKDSCRFSSLKKTMGKPINQQSRVLIIDNIGMLSSLYRYGNIAYIGGGFGAGIHNTLEAAAFGIPVIFGPNYHRFREATELIKCGGGFAISNIRELELTVAKLQSEAFVIEAGSNARNYVMNHTGATNKILDEIDRFN
ncbi:3-deoxy-D-manno-octulosonic acid transferase [Pedobacter sp. HMF7647]|uniref:3-deoxy-D-manno-octulosonic acid transferase n=1 Tax=Hufsiella arboris TaxID=2695275 RepID=A0A7K1YBA9_9SPHI|nr:glycosyltransferase N-terminal domain-containing protein [Hufsiella arboris]MXV51874.1 3-deoxy-D-manno-octulosonic acid transferase [Hufsiella arboris]